SETCLRIKQTYETLSDLLRLYQKVRRRTNERNTASRARAKFGRDQILVDLPFENETRPQ
ncbi:7623_t:CDS:1, partial [Entrophospora sp. SA101]